MIGQSVSINHTRDRGRIATVQNTHQNPISYSFGVFLTFTQGQRYIDYISSNQRQISSLSFKATTYNLLWLIERTIGY
jgi:hypothetical protein